MQVQATLICLALAIGLANGTLEARETAEPPVRYVLPLNQEFADILTVDLNDDGLLDLVTLETDHGKRDSEVRARVFLQNTAGFASTGPGDVLPSGAVLVGAGRFAQGPGLAILSSNTLTVWIWQGDRFAVQAQIPAESLLPTVGGILATGIDWVADLNGDGLSELLVPRPDGVALWRQDREGSWQSMGLLRCRARGQLLNLYRHKIAGYEVPTVYILDSRGRVGLPHTPPDQRAPSDSTGTKPALSAWNTIALFNDGMLYVFQPDDRLVPGDRPPVLQMDIQPPKPFDPAVPYDPPLQLIAAEDLNGDGLMDLVFTKVRSGDSDFNARTRVLVYYGRPTGSEAGFSFGTDPDQLYDSEGFTLPFLVDVNGDHRPDLVLVNVEVSFWTAIRALIARSVAAEAGFYFMPDKRQYPRQPDATARFSVKFSLGRAAPQPIAMFGDFNGDGLPDLLLSEDKDRLGIHWGRAKGVWQDSADESFQDKVPIRPDRVHVVDLNSDGSDDLIFTYGRDDIRQMPEVNHTVTVLLSRYGAPHAPARRPSIPAPAPGTPPARQRMAHLDRAR